MGGRGDKVTLTSVWSIRRHARVTLSTIVEETYIDLELAATSKVILVDPTSQCDSLAIVLRFMQFLDRLIRKQGIQHTWSE